MLQFITFLGTGRYELVPYITLDGSRVETAYVQVAILSAYRDQLPESSLTVFLTTESYERNWVGDTGLKKELECTFPDLYIEPVIINTVKNEETLWQLFDTMYNNIKKQHEIIFDITHAFRHLPLLGSAIVNYARSLKNCSVHAIYYGAYEAKDERGAPIIDLTKLDRLMQWSTAVDFFINSGNAEFIDKLVNQQVGHIRSHIEHPDPILNLERSFASTLKKMRPILATCRMQEIIDGRIFINIYDHINNILNETSFFIHPLRPLYEKISESLCKFKEGSVANILLAVHLCIKYSLIQQGITLLEEGIITIILYLLGEDNYYKKENRDAVSRFFQYIGFPNNNYTHPMNDDSCLEYRNIGEKIDRSRIAQELVTPFNKLRDIRNDINHAGCSLQPASAERFTTALFDCFKKTLITFEQSNDVVEPWLTEVVEWLLTNM